MRSGAANEPTQAQIDHLLAPYRQGDATAAAARARDFTRTWPRHPAGWQILSESSAALGHLDDAVDAAQRLVRIDPNQAEAHAHLGLLLSRSQRYRDAEKAYRNAIAIAPSFDAARFNLAKLYDHVGKTSKSADLYAGLLEKFPAWIEAKTNYGNVLRQLGRLSEAVSVLREADSSRPGEPIIKNNLARALFDRGDLAEAESVVRSALRIDPKNAQSLDQLGHVLSAAGRLEEAASVWGEGAELYPDYGGFHHNLGNLWYQYGDQRQAEEAYRAALTKRPDNAEFWRHLAQVKQFEPDDPDLAAIEALLAESSNLSATDRVDLHYAAGKAHQDIGSPAAVCWNHFARGARWQRSIIEYDVTADERFFAQMQKAFSQTIREPLESDESPVTPLFIVGMPRSGTTLIEEILGSHSRVTPLGESTALPACMRTQAAKEGKSVEQWIVSASRESLELVAASYCEQIREQAADRAFATDKMMLNFRFVGPILSCIPNARVVHVRRDPADTCLSCFTKRFSGSLHFTYDLSELGRYYRAYERLMDHWREVVAKGCMIDIDYESVVRHPEGSVRDLLRFCGLDWEDGCLHFERSGRAVDTASSLQVRKPLSEASIGKWRAFAPQLGPLFDALGPSAPPND